VEGGEREGRKPTRGGKNMFSSTVLIAGGTILATALLDKTCEDYGFQALGTVVKILLPIVAFAAGIYFIETNAIMGWLR
jgi:hypothetical protein